ncbi:chorismate synthase [Dethiobacter alkaliphilus]|uniref:chorismate synthase n=1 Tax=Dethiobacter alkaliphilus TaxID=427926 RepID=UPI0023EECCA8|nr:chorismate synthase [Dethiobacter alkaliphilus]
MMRFLTAGESHGPALCAIVEGLPANLSVDPAAVNRELARRQQGYGRGGRMKIEKDRVEVLTGLRFKRTLGSPLTLRINNRDFENWTGKMAPDGEAPEELDAVTRPRPGHADLAGAQKYNLADVRDVLERASARETAARVAVGAVAKEMLAAFGISVYSQVVSIGEIAADTLSPEELAVRYEKVENSPVRSADIVAEEKMKTRIDRAKADGDSLGGVFEVVVQGVPVGLGSHVQWDKKLDGRLAGALMSIQAIKGVEIGAGFEAAVRPGSLVHDEIGYEDGRGYFRLTNRAGGLEGGITNGEPLVVRAAMKPIPTLYKPLRSVDMTDHAPFEAAVERSDACAVPAAAIVGEAVVAWEVAVALREKLGGDSTEEMKANLENYLELLARR